MLSFLQASRTKFRIRVVATLGDDEQLSTRTQQQAVKSKDEEETGVFGIRLLEEMPMPKDEVAKGKKLDFDSLGDSSDAEDAARMAEESEADMTPVSTDGNDSESSSSSDLEMVKGKKPDVVAVITLAVEVAEPVVYPRLTLPLWIHILQLASNCLRPPRRTNLRVLIAA